MKFASFLSNPDKIAYGLVILSATMGYLALRLSPIPGSQRGDASAREQRRRRRPGDLRVVVLRAAGRAQHLAVAARRRFHRSPRRVHTHQSPVR